MQNLATLHVMTASLHLGHIGEESRALAITLLRGRLDKDRSLIDAISFNVMRQREITEALATDHHFEQARFI